MTLRQCIAAYIIAVLVFICASSGCERPANPVGGPHYYSRWDAYQFPIRLIGPISVEEAKRLDAYYEAYFNERRQISKLTKYLHGKLFFQFAYEYHANGKLKRKMTLKEGGEQEVQQFGEDGRPLRK
jgi:hypothetical protein